METLLNPFRGKPTYMSPRVKGYTDIQCICHPNLYGYTDTCRLGYLYQKSTFFGQGLKFYLPPKGLMQDHLIREIKLRLPRHSKVYANCCKIFGYEPFLTVTFDNATLQPYVHKLPRYDINNFTTKTATETSTDRRSKLLHTSLQGAAIWRI